MGKKYLEISLPAGFGKLELITVLSLLPEDAILKDADFGYSQDSVKLLFQSGEWASAPEGLASEYFLPVVSRADVERIGRALKSPQSMPSGPASDVTRWDRCYCDHAYTGIHPSVHRSQCPFRSIR